MGRFDCSWFNPFNKKYLQDNVRLSVCGVCLEKIEEDKELHHLEYYADGGLNEVENLCWLHSKCHKKLHRDDNNLRRKIKWKKILTKLREEKVI